MGIFDKPGGLTSAGLGGTIVISVNELLWHGILKYRENDGDDYEVVPDMPFVASRGRKCERCGVKFDYGVSYGFHCPDGGCPMGWN